MTRSAWAWVGVALLALGGLYAADDKEPAYNGKPLSAWAAQLKDKALDRLAANPLKWINDASSGATSTWPPISDESLIQPMWLTMQFR